MVVAEGRLDKQRRPEGPRLPCPNHWKLKVLDELERRGQTQAWLTAELEASEGGISGMLKPVEDGGYKTSAYVRPTCELFGWALPASDERRDRWNRAGHYLEKLKPEVYEAFLKRWDAWAEAEEQAEYIQSNPDDSAK